MIKGGIRRLCLMRKFLIKILGNLYIKLLKPNEIENVGKEIIPIIKCQAFRSNMNEEQIKLKVLTLMEKDLINYVEYETETKDDGTTLIWGKLKVIREVQYDK